MVNTQDVSEFMLACVHLQLRALQSLGSGKSDGKLDLTTLYRNIADTELPHVLFSDFVRLIENNRNKFAISDGVIGVDVNLIGLK